MSGEVENMADLRKKDPIQQVGSNERALRVGESCRLRAALLIIFWLIPALAGIKKGVPLAAASVSGPCPENPQTFEKV